MYTDKTQQLKYRDINGSENTLVRAITKTKWHNKIEIKVWESCISEIKNQRNIGTAILKWQNQNFLKNQKKLEYAKNVL